MATLCAFLRKMTCLLVFGCAGSSLLGGLCSGCGEGLPSLVVAGLLTGWLLSLWGTDSG